MELKACLIILAIAVAICSAHEGKRATRETTPTCDGVECPDGQECYLNQVQCIQAPCPPIPECRSVRRRRASCDVVRCRSGYTCVEENGRAVCKKNQQ